MELNRKTLHYYGTGTEVMQGDYIQYKTLFTRQKRLGRVSYIPEFTAQELADINKDSDDWLIELSDGTVTGWIYYPEDLQPPKRLTFIKRGEGEYKGNTPKELEEWEQSEGNYTTWRESILFSLIIIDTIVGLVFIFK